MGEEDHVSHLVAKEASPAEVPQRASYVAPKSPHSAQVEAFGITDKGLLRDVNEDAFAVLYEHGLYMVADGMGGAKAGDVASRMAIDCVREAFEHAADMTWPRAVGDECRSPSAPLLDAGLQRANTRILGIALRDSDKEGMGTTFAGLLVLAEHVVIAHVGDSRVYRLRGARFDQLTEDHTLVNAHIRAGRWHPDSAHSFPNQHTIMRAVGADDTLEVDFRHDAPAPDDLYLVCTDGLSNMLPREEIASIVRKYADLTRAASELIDGANRRGGLDNITAILVRWLGPPR
jgi:protein phosphatase